MEIFYRNLYEVCNEKRVKIFELQLFKYKEKEKSLRLFFFLEVLKRENTKFKRKERDYVIKLKKLFYKIVRLLLVILFIIRFYFRKFALRNLFYWIVRRIIYVITFFF